MIHTVDGKRFRPVTVSPGSFVWHRMCLVITMEKMRNTALLACAVMAFPPDSHASTNLPPSPIVQFWGGGRHTMALLADGSVWTWGSDVSGKLGDSQVSPSYNETNHDSFLPLRVHGPSNVGYLTSVVAISAGEGHNMALIRLKMH